MSSVPHHHTQNSGRSISFVTRWLKTMSSLASTCSLNRLATFSPPKRNLCTIQTPSILRLASHRRRRDSDAQKLKTIDEKPKASGSFGRREAIGFGVSFGLLGTCYEMGNDRRASAAEGNGACEFTVAPSGLEFCDKVVGRGPEAVQGQLIKAHYVGKLENGKVFDSSYNRGKPLTFRVGVGEVIKGWDQGIVGTDGVPPMLAGGKRTLKIPPELGYGVRGAGCRGGSCIIPPNSVLLFEVEFVGKA